MRQVRALAIAATTIAASVLANPCKAVIIYGNGTVGRDIDTSSVQDQGAQYQGQWLGSFTGTPIAPNWFITANHFGGSAGSPFVYQGQTYTTVSSTLIAGTDLRLWKIDGDFPSYASLYNESTDGSLINKPLYVFGRSAQPGTAVTTSGGSVFNGWRWGSTYDNALSWGTNTVHDSLANQHDENGNPLGTMLVFLAGTSSSTNGTLAVYDSGGGVFVQSQDDNTWKLAGVNYGVGPTRYSTSADGSNPFTAAIFNPANLYYLDDSTNTWKSTTTEAGLLAQTNHASSISANYDAIQAVIVPEPAMLTLAAVGAAVLGMRRRRPAR